MRIWSLHPQYLDTKGLLAVWRETLLAKHVLQGKTKGYKSHPQLQRFKVLANPVAAINHYLSEIYSEATYRGYKFDKSKIDFNFEPVKITVTNGQLEYETLHLLAKLKVRDIEKYKQTLEKGILLPHPIFTVMDGKIEDWEKLYEK